MEQTGEYLIEAPRGDVWAALNNAEILEKCISGCQSMDQIGEGVFGAEVKANHSPSGAVFQTGLSLSKLDLPNRYQISLNAKNVEGEDAGFMTGVAQLELTDVGGATRLHYSLQADLGADLAKIDPVLVDSTARQMADDFFARLAAEAARFVSSEVGAGVRAESEVDGEATAVDAGAEVPYEPSKQWVIWAIMFGVLLLAVLLTF